MEHLVDATADGGYQSIPLGRVDPRVCVSQASVVNFFSPAMLETHTRWQVSGGRTSVAAQFYSHGQLSTRYVSRRV